MEMTYISNLSFSGLLSHMYIADHSLLIFWVGKPQKKSQKYVKEHTKQAYISAIYNNTDTHSHYPHQ